MHCGQLQKETIAAGVINGLPQADIARQIGMNQATVSRAINKDDDVKALILGNYKKLITDALPKASENMQKLVEGFQSKMPDKYGKADLQLKDQQYDATKYVINLGLSSSHTPSTIIQQNFIQNNNNQYVSPATRKVIAESLGVIDAEIIDTDTPDTP